MRVLIAHSGRLFRFATVDSAPRDGSLIVQLRRMGDSHFRVGWSNRPDEDVPIREDFQTPRRKDKKITIHASGRINLPDQNPIYTEPLLRTTQAFSFIAYQIPRLTGLTEFSKEPSQDDIVWDLSALPDTPQSFEILLAPTDFSPPGMAVKIEYLRRYVLVIALHPEHMPIRSGFEAYCTTHSRLEGLFSAQQITEDISLIDFHQALNETRGLIIYHPNGKGEWHVVFAVQMRIPPKVKIEPVDPSLFVEVIDQSHDVRTNCAHLRFIVRKRATREIFHGPVPFQHFELNAELF